MLRRNFFGALGALAISPAVLLKPKEKLIGMLEDKTYLEFIETMDFLDGTRYYKFQYPRTRGKSRWAINALYMPEKLVEHHKKYPTKSRNLVYMIEN